MRGVGSVRAEQPLGPCLRRGNALGAQCRSARPGGGRSQTTRTEHGPLGRFHACSVLPGGRKLLTSLLRRGGGTGRRRRLKIARAHALRGSIPLLGINDSACLGRLDASRGTMRVPRRVPKLPGGPVLARYNARHGQLDARLSLRPRRGATRAHRRGSLVLQPPASGWRQPRGRTVLGSGRRPYGAGGVRGLTGPTLGVVAGLVVGGAKWRDSRTARCQAATVSGAAGAKNAVTEIAVKRKEIGRCPGSRITCCSLASP